MTFYIRLLSYLEACKIITFIDNMDECGANLVTGGVSVYVLDPIVDRKTIERELCDNYNIWEITEDSPHKVKEKIINELGLK